MSRTTAAQKSVADRYAWIALLSTIAVVPLAVAAPGIAPISVVNSFLFPQNLVLAFGVMVAVALWTWGQWSERSEINYSILLLPGAVLLAWSCVSTLVAVDPARSLFGASTSPMALTRIVTYSLLFFVTIQLLSSPGRLRALTRVVVISSTVVAVVALLQQLLSIDILAVTTQSPWYLDRGFSTLGNPDFLGTFLVIPAVLAGVCLLYERDRRWRVVYLVATVCTLSAAVGTLTRGAWIALFAGAVIATVLAWSGVGDMHARRRLLLAGAACVLALAIASTGTDLQRVSSRFSTTVQTGSQSSAVDTVNAASSGRIDIWTAALLGVRARPLMGTGPGAFEFAWFENAKRPTSIGGAADTESDPHSLPVFLAVTTGVPGLLAYLALVVMVLVFGLKSAWKRRATASETAGTSYYTAWVVASCALQIALLVAAVTTPIIMYAFLGLAIVARPHTSPRHAPSWTLDWRVVSATAALLGVAAALPLIPQMRAETAIAQAAESGPTAKTQRAAMAVRWDIGLQRAYFRVQSAGLAALFERKDPTAQSELDRIVTELRTIETEQTHEVYYPAIQAQLLADGSKFLGDPALAEAAVEAADRALVIMPASIPVRVNKALALGDLRRFDEMAQALSGYWENETVSSYPGVLYAQALALSGDAEGAWRVFDRLEEKFPKDVTIKENRKATEKLIQSPQ